MHVQYDEYECLIMLQLGRAHRRPVSCMQIGRSEAQLAATLPEALSGTGHAQRFLRIALGLYCKLPERRSRDDRGGIHNRLRCLTCQRILELLIVILHVLLLLCHRQIRHQAVC